MTPLKENEIVPFVCKHYGVTEVRWQRRTRSDSIIKHAVWYVARKMLNIGVEEIGNHFGGVDHSSVVYAVQRFEQMLKDVRGERERELVKKLDLPPMVEGLDEPPASHDFVDLNSGELVKVRITHEAARPLAEIVKEYKVLGVSKCSTKLFLEPRSAA